jgi:hypothetical protein
MEEGIFLLSRYQHQINHGPHVLFAGRVSMALGVVLVVSTGKLQLSPQFLKKCLPLLGCFFC